MLLYSQMPQTKSAKKALRRDRRRQKVNSLIRQKVKQAVKSARKMMSIKKLSEAYKEVDRAVKKDLIHKNKAARLKSRLAKRAGQTTIEEKVKAWKKSRKKKTPKRKK